MTRVYFSSSSSSHHFNTSIQDSAVRPLQTFPQVHYVTLRYMTLHYVTLRYITLHVITISKRLSRTQQCTKSPQNPLQTFSLQVHVTLYYVTCNYHFNASAIQIGESIYPAEVLEQYVSSHSMPLSFRFLVCAQIIVSDIFKQKTVMVFEEIIIRLCL